MGKEQIKSIQFNEKPDVRIRVIEDTDTEPTIKSKIQYPFELFNTVNVTIITTQRKINFDIYNGYTYNGADIPRFLWRIVGSRTDNEFLVASMLHDYMLQFKRYIYNEIFEKSISINQYRRLTSLIFREKLKRNGVKPFKANTMSWFVDIFQHYFNYKNWKI